MSIPELPPELFIRIFSHINDYPALAAVSLTSHHFHDLAHRRLYTKPQLGSAVACRHLWCTLESAGGSNLGRAIHSLTLRRQTEEVGVDLDDRVVAGLVEATKNTLEELTVRFFELGHLADILSISQRLKKVFLLDCELGDPSSSRSTPPSNSVKTLTVQRCRFSPTSLPSTCFSSLTSLRILHNATDLSASSIISFLANLPTPEKLRRLSIILHPLWTERTLLVREAWADALRRFTALARLELDWMYFFSEDEDEWGHEGDDLRKMGGLLNLFDSMERLHWIGFYMPSDSFLDNIAAWTLSLSRDYARFPALKMIVFQTWASETTSVDQVTVNQTRWKALQLECRKHLSNRGVLFKIFSQGLVCNAQI